MINRPESKTQRWNYRPGWIRWAKKWHRIVRVQRERGKVDRYAAFVTLCTNIPGPGKDFPDSEYRLSMPTGVCRPCLYKYLSHDKPTLTTDEWDRMLG